MSKIKRNTIQDTSLGRVLPKPSIKYTREAIERPRRVLSPLSGEMVCIGGSITTHPAPPAIPVDYREATEAELLALYHQGCYNHLISLDDSLDATALPTAIIIEDEDKIEEGYEHNETDTGLTEG